MPPEVGKWTELHGPASRLPEDARLESLRRNRAWWSGEHLDRLSGVPFWMAEQGPARSTGADTLQWGAGNMRPEHRVHVPVAADLALTSADFLFGGGLQITSKDAGVMAAVDALDVESVVADAAERCSGIGEVYLRVGWDGPDATLIAVDGDRVWPTFRYGRLVAASLVNTLPKIGTRHYRHIEVHEPGLIRHELWAGSGGGKWALAPLTAHPMLAEYPPELTLPPALARRLALVPVINATSRTGRSGGRSDTEGQEAMMGAIDEAISGLQRDIRLGKARIVVDETMLTRTAALAGNYFDTAAEVFAPLGATDDGSMRQMAVPIQFDIRSTAHLDATRDYVRRVVSSAGYSPESLSPSQQALPESAAARRLREFASIRTTARKARRWRRAIIDAVQVAVVIAADRDGRTVSAPPITVELAPTIAPEMAERAGTVALMTQAGSASTETKVRYLHPDWDDVMVATEVAAIGAETSPTMPATGGGE